MEEDEEVSQTNDGTWDNENEKNVDKEVSEDQVSHNNLEVINPSNIDLAKADESVLPDTSDGNIKIANEDKVPVDEITIEVKQSDEEIVHKNEVSPETKKEETSAILTSKIYTPAITFKNSADLDKLLKNEEELRNISSNDIIYSPALITRSLSPITPDPYPVIRRGTINVVQGAQGSHKSRFTALLAICLIKSPDHELNTLGYEKVVGEEVTVIYFDTERNQAEECAEAIQSIVRNAGYNTAHEIPNFRFTSLKNILKKGRLNAIKEFISTVRCETTNPLFVIIDVVTDIIENFNNPAQSMALFDYLGNLAESQLATVLLTIHENPGSNKARGHAGTEAINKASYAVSIAFQLDKQGERTNVIWLKEVKNRHAERIEPVALEYDDETKLLKLGDPDYARWILNQNRIKPSAESYLVKLAEYLVSPMDQQTLIGKLMTDFSCSENTVRNRLKEIELKNAEIYVDDKIFNLLRFSVNGKSTTYELCEVGNS